jgi:hypothetical protein
MRLTRRTVRLPDYWYCNEAKCPAGLTGKHRETQTEAEAHAADSGHEVRVVATFETILRLAPQQPLTLVPPLHEDAAPVEPVASSPGGAR